ncbi:MAG TPA: lysozyme inhibitor LprI family protein [Gemmatimonadaceae bacterium]|jgi:uncharacterized protein YecT (DUF1311 family)
MKGTRSFSTLAALCVIATAACSKSKDKKDVAAVAQDTMLLHDLAEANRNTAAAEATDSTQVVSHSNTGGGLGSGALTSGSVTSGATNASGTNAGAMNQVATSTVRPPAPKPRISAPTGSGDARGPTNVSARMDSGNSPSSRSTSGDPCDSPSMGDQRSCLNRSIATNDASLNRVYQDLISQARTSGGAELEERFRQRQRDWINQRDVDCRQQATIADGHLWARDMAACLADYSRRRTSELQSSLNQLRGQ